MESWSCRQGPTCAERRGEESEGWMEGERKTERKRRAGGGGIMQDREVVNRERGSLDSCPGFLGQQAWSTGLIISSCDVTLLTLSDTMGLLKDWFTGVILQTLCTCAWTQASGLSRFNTLWTNMKQCTTGCTSHWTIESIYAKAF